jgi:hypothetical protein
MHKNQGMSAHAACALHLWDLIRAYPGDPSAPSARVKLKWQWLCGVEARQRIELRAARASERPGAPSRLIAARRKLTKLICCRAARRQGAFSTACAYLRTTE